MSDQTKFNHISVTPADDDIVIIAGARSEASAQAAPDAVLSTSAEEAKVQPVTSDTAALTDVSASDISASAPSSNESSTKADDVKTAGTQSAEMDAPYRPTTLEDIESSRMPKAQRVVVALAVCGVAAFAIWYIVANGVIA